MVVGQQYVDLQISYDRYEKCDMYLSLLSNLKNNDGECVIQRANAIVGC